MARRAEKPFRHGRKYRVTLPNGIINYPLDMIVHLVKTSTFNRATQIVIKGNKATFLWNATGEILPESILQDPQVEDMDIVLGDDELIADDEEPVVDHSAEITNLQKESRKLLSLRGQYVEAFNRSNQTQHDYTQFVKAVAPIDNRLTEIQNRLNEIR